MAIVIKQHNYDYIKLHKREKKLQEINKSTRNDKWSCEKIDDFDETVLVHESNKTFQ